VNHATIFHPADRFAQIIDGLCQAVAARSRGNAVSGALIFLLWNRLRRFAGRFARLAATLRIGGWTLRPPELPAVRPECEQRTPGQPASEQRATLLRKRRPRLRPNGQPDRLPDGFCQGRGWLVRLVPEAAVCTSQLEHLLADPEMAAMALASPPMARLLRALCRMLAVDPSPLPPPPRRRPSPSTGLGPAASNVATSALRDTHHAARPDTPEPVPKRRRVRLVRPAWHPPW